MNSKKEIMTVIKQLIKHDDIVQFKSFIELALNKDLRDNTHLQYIKQLLCNSTVNALILAQQNNINYNELYQGTL